jgi:hypothetical protein
LPQEANVTGEEYQRVYKDWVDNVRTHLLESRKGLIQWLIQTPKLFEQINTISVYVKAYVESIKKLDQQYGDGKNIIEFSDYNLKSPSSIIKDTSVEFEDAGDKNSKNLNIIADTFAKRNAMHSLLDDTIQRRDDCLVSEFLIWKQNEALEPDNKGNNRDKRLDYYMRIK